MKTPPLRLSRRCVLRGLGATVALPFLESLAPRRARAQELEVAKRFFAFFVPNGVHMPSFTPATTGSSFSLPPVLAPLSSVRDQVLVLSGLDNFAATAQGDGAGDHARGTSTFLTCTHPQRGVVYNGVSVDQVIAQQVGGRTRLKSLELGCEGGDAAGACDSGYACSYQRNIAWATPYTPLSKEVNPRLVFDRLFAGTDATLTAEQIARRKREDLSVLDFVLDDTRRLKPTLGGRDQQKLDEYLTGLRELEVRVEATDESQRCEVPGRPDGVPVDIEAYVKTMLDLAALAFQCDQTRVITFMLANGGSNRHFPWLNITSAHHELSHHQGSADKQAKLEKINVWEMEMFRHFLERLDGMEEMGADGMPGSVLDNTVAVLGSELRDGNAHDHEAMPCVLAGRGGGLLNPGRHVRFEEGTPIADMYLTVLHALGVERESFGDDGTELLAELLA